MLAVWSGNFRPRRGRIPRGSARDGQCPWCLRSNGGRLERRHHTNAWILLNEIEDSWISTTDSLTTADCAPSSSNRFAKVYGLAASAGDSVTVMMRPLGFAGSLAIDSILSSGAPPLAEGSDCPVNPGHVCLRYVFLRGGGPFFTRATTLNGGETGSFTIEVTSPRPPTAPGQLAQLEDDSSTTIPVGGAIADTVAVLRAAVDDPDIGDTLTLEVEVLPLGTAFNGTPTHTSLPVLRGATGVVSVDDLNDDVSYHWQARATDRTGRSSTWVAFGGNGEGTADLEVAIPVPPDPPTSLAQLRSDSTTPIAVGAVIDEASVVLSGSVSDPDVGDSLRLEVEVRPIGTAFTDTPTDSSTFVVSGMPAPVSVGGLSDDTNYHWQARAVDAIGQASAWVAFGGNPESGSDFGVAVPGTPDVPSSPDQLLSDGTTPIGIGQTTGETTVVFGATLIDPDLGDQVRLEIEVRPVGTPFTDVPTVSSGQVGSGNAVTVAVSNLTDDTDFHWQARAVDQGGNASAWVAFGSNAETAADFSVAIPEAPALPTGTDQLQSNATTVIPVGGTTGESTVVFRGTISDPDPGDMLRLQVEVQPVGTPFSDSPGATSGQVSSGSVATLSVTSLADDSDYHWQARTVDQSGRASAWISFGGNAESAADFRTAIPEPPAVATGLGQFRSNGTTPITIGMTIDEATVVFTATLSDPDPGDLIRLQIEVQPVGTPFAMAPTDSSSQTASRNAASVTVAALSSGTDYHWQARVTDQGGRVDGCRSGATPNPPWTSAFRCREHPPCQPPWRNSGRTARRPFPRGRQSTRPRWYSAPRSRIPTSETSCGSKSRCSPARAER